MADRAAHARLLNSFSRMEYVGVRKILKSRRSDDLDHAGLQHILDETVHALRLKKAALALSEDPAAVATYSAAHTLAGDAGEAYLQGVDQAAAEALADLPEDTRADINYVLTSAAIEIRAQAFYPLYESCLRATGASFSVSAILKDEDRHLGEMAAQLAARLPDWRRRLERVLEVERDLFAAFMAAVSAVIEEPQAPRRGAPAVNA